MGLLEDAIREHLELKRRHGASDDELLREESDALGPARHDQAPAAPAEELVQPEAPQREEGVLEESVLEETPDFLPETPEQGGVGSEQKPPRDFDFD
ncbi:MAG: hypothetical protein ABR581_05245 [Thermoleophilaceae bacterium]